MKSSSLLRLIVCFCAAFFGASLLQAQDLATVRSRMEKRIPSITALKDKGAVGESNHGFLEVRGQVAGGDQQLVSEENSDRRRVYAAIAAETGSSADAVGRKRAQQLADLARPGHWIQDAGGGWKRK